MAGNKVSSKAKGKEDKGKLNKNISQNHEDAEDVDYSLLRKPIPTSITGFAQARKVFDLATEELKELLTNECDLLYECKVCRNLFRSLMNFISHKRIYCKEKFNCMVHSHFNINTANNELLKIKKFEEDYQEFLKQKVEYNKDNIDETEENIPLTKDLTTVLEKIITTRGIQEEQLKQQDVVLQKIPKTSVAVYQSIKYNDTPNSDDMRTQVKELDTIFSKQNAILQTDGTFRVESNMDPETESVIQISDDEDNDCVDNLKCKVCDLQFSTQKTLKSHIKTKHLESRIVYPCPDCFEIFSTSWSVYRHLFKVHRKTAAQIRRMRETIQSKAFRMNNPPAFYEKRKANIKATTTTKISDEERIDQENQAWMDNMEGDGELPRCGGCGRTFERRAALAAHTNTCQPRSRALARRPQETKKIEIQIRKDYNKGPTNVMPVKSQDKVPIEEVPSSSKPQLQKPKKDMPNENTLTEAIMSIVGVTNEQEVIDNEITEPSAEPQPEQDSYSILPEHKLPFSHQAEKSNFNALKQRLLKDVEIERLLCKKCDTKFKLITELYDHIAGHYKWMRYACKLCNFKNYDLDKVLDHVKVVHKLKGDSDFYFSTVKAIDGVEALLLSEFTDESIEPNQTSLESRRPSRCSSDSSRLSDDSSSSSTRIETGSRKRKTNPFRHSAKKKRETVTDENDGDSKDGEDSPQKEVIQMENDSSSNSKVFDENSSDLDDAEEKSKRLRLFDSTSVALRRPVRKRTKPKNEDFEYDLSNLLKMEAQGYRESQSISSVKTFTNKKKTLDVQNNYSSINKECCGALYSLSRLAVDANKGHMKTTNFAIFNATKEQRISNIFVRPMLPKISRVEKISPIKESADILQSKESVVVIDSPEKESTDGLIQKETLEDKPPIILDKETNFIATNSLNNESSKVPEENPSNQTISESNVQDKNKNNLNLVPIKLRKQSLDLIKNPLIKKNITDFSKAGMKTKILVIKPINRKDGSQSINAPLKFQTIKLKDPVNISNEEKKSDQVVVVKVPKVDCARPAKITNNNNDNATTPDTATKAHDQEKDREESCDEKYNKADDENANCNIKNDSIKSDLCSSELKLGTDTDVAVKS